MLVEDGLVARAASHFCVFGEWDEQIGGNEGAIVIKQHMEGCPGARAHLLLPSKIYRPSGAHLPNAHPALPR